MSRRQDKYGNNVVLGLTETQWPPVLLFAACGLPARNFWIILGNAVFWYALAFLASPARRWG